MLTTKNTKIIDFLKQRRSTVAKKMQVGRVLKKDLNTILEIGTRVPDHGSLKPWSIKVIQGIKIGERSMVGVGAAVYKDLGNASKLYVAKPFTA